MKEIVMIGLIIIICLIVILAIALITVTAFEINDDIGSRDFCIGTIIVIVITCVVSLVINSTHAGEPTAMDVYRGKTTLEITYKDNVPIDSTVVFK